MYVEKQIYYVYIGICKNYEKKFSTYQHHIIYNILFFKRRK